MLRLSEIAEMKVDLTNPKNWINPKTGEKYHYFSRNGEGYDDVLDWAKHSEDRKTKIVKQEYVFFGLFWVSTVWLGLDHSWSPLAPPLIFESMVFPKHTFGELDMNRYTTEEEALIGHKELVKKWSNPLFIFWHFFWSEWLEDITWKFRRK